MQKEMIGMRGFLQREFGKYVQSDQPQSMRGTLSLFSYGVCCEAGFLLYLSLFPCGGACRPCNECGYRKQYRYNDCCRRYREIDAVDHMHSV